ncbi:hypothetical protein FZZ93_03095 [Halomonas eurihalina]|uniref:Class I SAM-dependent methyltransferase n=1 Tax=Halomonas eurihalina TaxID=42566 RepID=A0A5D9DCD4_HALER|nr:hypothetical protein [Halomonas eurihalina]MDR5859274.1 hypothetical protein [Halomonas eurihalina]TZG40902.1 hypothetical protein FZZ93_03095 [Halomonas eurihalina]
MLNTKADAWDIIGSLFWEQGRQSAKPSQPELELFTKGIGEGSRVCVVGASTKDLVDMLLDRGAEVTVYDFSQGMCSSLEQAMGTAPVTIRQLDITAPLDDELTGSYDYVLNDRLINRFTWAEAKSALMNMCTLAHDGEVRASIKLGHYPMDLRMIAMGEERGTLASFYDRETRTIDFSRAGTVLDDALLPHGDIDPALLLEWYRGRAAEKRFEDEDVVSLATAIAPTNGKNAYIVGRDTFADAGDTTLFTFIMH